MKRTLNIQHPGEIQIDVTDSVGKCDSESEIPILLVDLSQRLVNVPRKKLNTIVSLCMLCHILKTNFKQKKKRNSRNYEFRKNRKTKRCITPYYNIIVLNCCKQSIKSKPYMNLLIKIKAL